LFAGVITSFLWKLFYFVSRIKKSVYSVDIMNTCRIITIVGQKGGSGKSVTAVNLAASLALLEKKTLVVDCDPSAVATSCAGLNNESISVDLSSVFSGKTKLENAVLNSKLRFMDVIPSSLNLFQVASRLSKKTGNEKILRILLRQLIDDYEYIIIDPPSSFSFLTVTAMAASDWLVVPFQCNTGSIEPFNSLLKMIRYIRNSFQIRLRIAGLLFTMCDSREEIDRFLGRNELDGVADIVYATHIPWDDNIGKAVDEGKPVALYDLESSGSKAFMQYAIEVISLFK